MLPTVRSIVEMLHHFFYCIAAYMFYRNPDFIEISADLA